MRNSQLIVGYLIIYDLIAVSGAFFIALLLRFDFRFSVIPELYLEPWIKIAPFYAFFCVVVFWALRLYKSLWRFASFTELERISVATVITCAIHIIVITIFLQRMPISYYMMGTFLQFVFTVAIRFAYRFILLLRAEKKGDELNHVMLIGMHSIIGTT